MTNLGKRLAGTDTKAKRWGMLLSFFDNLQAR